MLKNTLFKSYFYLFGIIVAFTFSCDGLGNKNKVKSDDEIVDFILKSNNGIKDSLANQMFNKGVFYINHSDFPKAREYFQKADSICPNTPVILNSIGNVTSRIDGGLEAIRYFDKALKYDSSFIKTYNNYGCCLNGLKKYKEAKNIFYLGLERTSKYKFDRQMIYVNLADSYYMLGQKRKALELLDSAKINLEDKNLHDEIIYFEDKINSESLK